MRSDSFLSDMGPRSTGDPGRPSLLSADPAVFVPPEIRALSDVELIQATRALSRAVGAYAWGVVPIATIVTGAILGSQAAIIACVVAIALCKLGLMLYERSPAVVRGQLAKREFCARYHIAALALDEAAALSQLAEDDSLEAVVLFRAWALPHGGHRFIRVQLGADNRMATYATPFLGDLQRHPIAHTRMTRLDLPLSAADAGRLRDACARLAAAPLEQQPHGALADASLLGLPCDLIVLRRDAASLRIGMNFRGDAGAGALNPAELLVSTLLEIEAETAGADHLPANLLPAAEHEPGVPRSV